VKPALVNSIKIKNFLSFGPDAQEIELRSLNIVIGPNGSGKSNLLEGLALMQSAPGILSSPIREGGGVRDWLWKGGGPDTVASLALTIDPFLPPHSSPLRYQFDFTESNKRFEIVDERIEYAFPAEGKSEPYFFYRYENKHPVLNIKRTADAAPIRRVLRREDVDPERSILAQRRDPDTYPEITRLAEVLSDVRMYREWSFGRYTPARLPQATDAPNKWMAPDASNLALILSKLKRNPVARSVFINLFRAIYSEVVDVDVLIEGGTAQIFVQEEKFIVPATRLSDGTLRYLCLLAILCDPAPPPLICIDEPELGLHPDVVSKLAEALRYASERTQLIVTTHSAALVDAFTQDPEAILVCEKEKGATVLRRLDMKQLEPWLKTYRLGALWTSGEIGGTRW